MKVFKAEASPDGRAEDEIAVTCAVDHPHLIRVLALVAQPHAMIVDRVMGSPVPQIRHSGSPSPATPLRPLPPGASALCVLGLATSLSARSHASVASTDLKVLR